MQLRMEELEAKNRNLEKELAELKVKDKELCYLSHLGLECVLIYMDPNKRLLVSYLNEKFRKMEKSITLHLDRLEFTQSRIWVNGIKYEFRSEEDIIYCSDPQYPMYEVHDACIPFPGKENSFGTLAEILFSRWFEGRTDIQVKTLLTGNWIPYTKMNVETLVLDWWPYRVAYYCNSLVGSIKRLLILKSHINDVLDMPWIEDVERLEMLHTNRTNLMPFIQNLRAQAIYIYFFDILECMEVIRKWLEMKTRKIGSQLFLVINQKNEDSTIDSIFMKSDELGFVAVSQDRRQKQIFGNNSKVKLTVREDTYHFSREFLERAEFRRYLCFEIVDSSNRFT